MAKMIHNKPNELTATTPSNSATPVATSLFQPWLTRKSIIVYFPVISDRTSGPFQRALAPGINQRDAEQQDEDNQLEHGEECHLVEGHRKREQKHRFNVKDQEDQGVHIILHLELYPRRPNRFDAAFVGLLLDLVRTLRL